MKSAKWENILNLLLGAWLFISPWVISHNLPLNQSDIVSWNFYVVGAMVVIAAILALQELKPWEEWVSLLLGIWMALSPWLLGYSSERGLAWNSILVGLAIALFSGLALPAAQKLQHQS